MRPARRCLNICSSDCILSNTSIGGLTVGSFMRPTKMRRLSEMEYRLYRCQSPDCQGETLARRKVSCPYCKGPTSYVDEAEQEERQRVSFTQAREPNPSITEYWWMCHNCGYAFWAAYRLSCPQYKCPPLCVHLVIRQ